MLNSVDPQSHGSSSTSVDDVGGSDLHLDGIIKAARRQILIIIAFCLAGLALGAAYIKNATPQYTATAVLFIDSPKDQSTISASIADLTYDSGAIDSQLEVLKSEGTASSVIAALKLDTNPEFLRVRTTPFRQWLNRVRSIVDLSRPAPEEVKSDSDKQDDIRRGLVDQLKSSVDVRRVGRSYVIDIDYTSPDRLLAANVANGFASSFINDQLASKVNAMKQTAQWLEGRTAEFKQKWVNADLATQKFKADNGLITADGKLVGDQQIAQLSTQLTLAQSETAKAQARYAQIQNLIESKDIDGVVAESLSNPVINDIRQKYLTASRLEKEISATLGPDHPQAGNLRRSMADDSDLIFGEMKRIAESYKSEAEVARAKEQSLRDSIANLALQTNSVDQKFVNLRVLEGETENNRTLYATFVQRLQNVQEKQTFPEAEARVITKAAPPNDPAYPKRLVVMVMSLVLGGLAGVGVGAWREYRDRAFRTGADVRDGMQLEFLGMLPFFKTRRSKTVSTEAPGSTIIETGNALLRYSIDYPFTIYSETLRGMKVAADIEIGQQVPKIIGMLSMLPDEGKTTVSKNFASLVANLGEKVLLIDGDLIRHGLTTALADHATLGLVDVIRGEIALRDAIMVEPETGLSFLPAVLAKRSVNSSQLLSSPGMRKALQDAGAMFDYIVIDLPPVGPVAGVRAAASMFDGFIFVVEWGRTTQSMFQETLLGYKEMRHKCIGVVYNKVRMNKIKLYEGMESKVFHQNEFRQYIESDHKASIWSGLR